MLAAPPALRDPRSRSPWLASILSLVPGLGQVYLGYYQRGFVHAIVVASLMSLLVSTEFGPLHPLGVVFMVFFWLYNVIDAGRRASLYNLALVGTEPIEPPRDFSMPGFRGSILGGVILILAGAILLSHTRFAVPLDWVEDWWPLALILFGLYLLVRAIQERRTEPAE
jgi:hypothetical protein